MPAVEIRGLTKRFGSLEALAGVDLELGEGEVLGLLGPNGAGKSTLVRALMGRVRPDRGEILLFGRSAAAPGARDALGYVPQEIALYPALSAAENLRVFGRYLGLQGEALGAAVARGLEFANLVERSGDRIEEYSGGMKRRLNLAVGILNAPRVVLLDEPTVGVDPQSRERIYGMIGELAGSGVAILYTTHYMEEAERLCDRVAVIDHGRVIAVGTREELVRSTVGAGRRVVVHGDRPVPPELADRFPGAVAEGTQLSLSTESVSSAVPALLAAFESAGLGVRDLELVSPGLESVFLHLTGRELRE
ncbi:MAG TPA: ABC transporter ATP-binding protein [Thermoanaerobaculia bacterium]|nr:ABC transporter ATP-binding protein [Thermoanaerobaculia bacterium]